MKIDIGGGLHPEPGFVNLDPVHGEAGWKFRAQRAVWPTPSESVTEIRASHVMEHIPAGVDRIAVFNEAWRVLVKGGTFTVVVPLLMPQDGGYWRAVADPTHVSFWVPESFDYFIHEVAAADYGIKYWEGEPCRVDDGWQGTWIGRKP